MPGSRHGEVNGAVDDRDSARQGDVGPVLVPPEDGSAELGLVGDVGGREAAPDGRVSAELAGIGIQAAPLRAPGDAQPLREIAGKVRDLDHPVIPDERRTWLKPLRDPGGDEDGKAELLPELSEAPVCPLDSLVPTALWCGGEGVLAARVAHRGRLTGDPVLNPAAAG